MSDFNNLRNESDDFKSHRPPQLQLLSMTTGRPEDRSGMGLAVPPFAAASTSQSRFAN